MPGMRMSISTTSGRCSATACGDLAAVGGLADDRDVLGAREQHRQPGAHERVVVDDQHADLVAHSGHGSHARSRKSPSPSRPCSRRPPASVGALGEADEAGARSRGSRSRPPPGPAAGLRTSIVRPSPGAPVDAQVDRRPPARACARSSAPPGRSAARGGRPRPGRPPGRRRATSACRRMPAARDSSSSAGSAASVGCGGCGASPSAPVAQHADHRAQVLERLVRAGADHRGGARDLLGRRVRAELQRAGVQAQQRDPVGEHVVHLARDPRALGRSGPARRAAAARPRRGARARAAPGGARGRTCPGDGRRDASGPTT